MPKSPLSSCCNAPMILVKKRQENYFYECPKCGSPCTLAEPTKEQANAMQVPHCTCTSFFTVKGKHKPDCPYFTSVRERELREAWNKYSRRSEIDDENIIDCIDTSADYWLHILHSELERKAKEVEGLKKSIKYPRGFDVIDTDSASRIVPNKNYNLAIDDCLTIIRDNTNEK